MSRMQLRSYPSDALQQRYAHCRVAIQRDDTSSCFRRGVHQRQHRLGAHPTALQRQQYHVLIHDSKASPATPPTSCAHTRQQRQQHHVLIHDSITSPATPVASCVHTRQQWHDVLVYDSLIRFVNSNTLCPYTTEWSTLQRQK